MEGNTLKCDFCEAEKSAKEFRFRGEVKQCYLCFHLSNKEATRKIIAAVEMAKHLL